MIQVIVAFVLFVSLVAGVIWVVFRELARGSRQRRELHARWEAELRQDVAADPRFWHSHPAIGQNPAATDWAANDARDG